MTDDRKTPEPGGVYRWYDVSPRPDSLLTDPFADKVLHIAMPCTLAGGVVRVITSDPTAKPWAQDYVPACATLMIPADKGVDVPTGQPRVIVRDLPERLDLGNADHRRVFDRALTQIGGPAFDADLSRAVAAVRKAMNAAVEREAEAVRMGEFRQQAKELLKGTIDQRIDRIAELMRQAEDGPDEDGRDWE